MNQKSYSFEERAREKQASRDKDEQDLLSGKKTREQLRKENGYFSQLNYVIDFSKAKSLC